MIIISSGRKSVSILYTPQRGVALERNFFMDDMLSPVAIPKI